MLTWIFLVDGSILTTPYSSVVKASPFSSFNSNVAVSIHLVGSKLSKYSETTYSLNTFPVPGVNANSNGLASAFRDSNVFDIGPLPL